jgi:large subunit ribosomal protein L32
MAVPKRKVSRSATRTRRSANYKLTPAAHSVCPNCNTPRLPHRVCANCGFYRDRIVIDVE